MREFVGIARIVKARGLKGEVKAELLTDFPERFAERERLRIQRDERVYWVRLDSYWFHNQQIILKFSGRDRPEQVEELIGGAVQITQEERVELPAGTYYDSDLAGCTVKENAQLVGTVKEVFKPGPDVTNLVVTGVQGEEIMIPMVDKFIREVDIERRVIRVSLPPSLKDVATPPARPKKPKIPRPTPKHAH